MNQKLNATEICENIQKRIGNNMSAVQYARGYEQ